MADFTITTNANEVAATIKAILGEINFQKEALFGNSVRALADDAKRRIKSQNNGQWAAVSKWIRAKKDPDRVLEGAEAFVKFRVRDGQGEVYGDTQQDWTLTQHHEGFENKTRASEVIDGKIEIDIVNPGPLGLGSNARTFAWSPNGKIGHTPARQIWADDAQTTKIVLPIASRWLQKVVTDALAGKGGVLSHG